MKIYIVRGVPGSGKSTWVDNNKPKNMAYEVCSADHYFTDHTGAYRFDPSQLAQAHASCIRKFVDTVAGNNFIRCTTDTIFVDNTNITVAEIAPYYQVGVSFGHDVEIVTIDVPPTIAHPRNLHGVDFNTVNSRWNAMQVETKRFPRYWKHRIVKELEPHG